MWTGCCRSGVMPCESCGIQFSVFRRRRGCPECSRWFCGACLRRGGGVMCAPCRALSTRPLFRNNIVNLKPRDLQAFLQRQNVSTRGVLEKEELVSLCLSHVNSTAYRRRSHNGAFSSLKGFTNNLNNLINQTFNIATPAPAPPPHSECYNTSHSHPPPPPAAASRAPPRTHPPSSPTTVATPQSSPSPPSSVLLETADCFEVEDVDDSWELLQRPAGPLPCDSEVLLTEAEQTIQTEETLRRTPETGGSSPESDNLGPREDSPVVETESPGFNREPESDLGTRLRTNSEADPRDRLVADLGARLGAELVESGGTPQRAASSLELREGSEARDQSDASSLQDEAALVTPACEPPRVTLESLSDAEELRSLSVRQLRQLLVANRVDTRGCLERDDLLTRAAHLYRDHQAQRHNLDDLPMESLCKICLEAPLECVLLECGHWATCTRCAARLHECPICRRYVARVVRVFKC